MPSRWRERGANASRSVISSPASSGTLRRPPRRRRSRRPRTQHGAVLGRPPRGGLHGAPRPSPPGRRRLVRQDRRGRRGAGPGRGSSSERHGCLRPSCRVSERQRRGRRPFGPACRREARRGRPAPGPLRRPSGTPPGPGRSASLTADSDVPPRSKKWSRRPTWPCGTPSTSAQAAANRRSVGVAGRVPADSAAASSSAANAVSALRSILPLAVSGSRPGDGGTAGRNHVGGQRLGQSGGAGCPRRAAAAGVEGHERRLPSAARRPRPRRRGPRARAAACSRSRRSRSGSPRILTWRVPAAEELQLSVRQPAAVVAAAVEPLPRPLRVGRERRPRCARDR